MTRALCPNESRSYACPEQGATRVHARGLAFAPITRTIGASFDDFVPICPTFELTGNSRPAHGRPWEQFLGHRRRNHRSLGGVGTYDFSAIQGPYFKDTKR